MSVSVRLSLDYFISGNPPLSEDDFLAFNDNEPEFYDHLTKKYQKDKYWSTSNLPLTCAIAAKASRKRRWVYAISKYYFSVSLFSIHHVDLDPSYGAEHFPVSKLPDCTSSAEMRQI